MTSHKTIVRVRIEFVMEIPGYEVPSATREAIDAAALAISGPPFHVLPGASVIVEPHDDADAYGPETYVATGRAPASRRGRGRGGKAS